MSIDTANGASLSVQVAEEIRAVMGRKQIRQSQLARLINANEQWLSVRLRGAQDISLNDLARIAAGLGVDPLSLIAGPAAGLPKSTRYQQIGDRAEGQRLSKGPTSPARISRPPIGRPPSRGDGRRPTLTRFANTH